MQDVASHDEIKVVENQKPVSLPQMSSSTTQGGARVLGSRRVNVQQEEDSVIDEKDDTSIDLGKEAKQSEENLDDNEEEDDDGDDDDDDDEQLQDGHEEVATRQTSQESHTTRTIDPHPHDVILGSKSVHELPLAYRSSTWLGNQLFQRLIRARRDAFVACQNRMKQKHMALEIVERIYAQQPPGRFIKLVASDKEITGRECDEADVLKYLGAALRAKDDQEEAQIREQHFQSDSESSQKVKVDDGEEGEEEEEEEEKDPKNDDDEEEDSTNDQGQNRQDGEEHQTTNMFVSCSQSSDENGGNKESTDSVKVTTNSTMQTANNPPGWDPMDIQTIYMTQVHSAEPSSNTYASRTDDADDANANKKRKPARQSAGSAPKSKKSARQQHQKQQQQQQQKEQEQQEKQRQEQQKQAKQDSPDDSVATKKRKRLPKVTSTKPPQVSLQPQPQHEGELPKGVTMRPSGKWQAQIYFAGQSRYLGVFENSRDAAYAFEACQKFLYPYKKDYNKNPDHYTKEKLAWIHEEARRSAAQALCVKYGGKGKTAYDQDN